MPRVTPCLLSRLSSVVPFAPVRGSSLRRSPAATLHHLPSGAQPLTLPKTAFNSDHTFLVSTRTALVRPTMPSNTNQCLHTTTNSSNFGPLCTINPAVPLLKSRTGQTTTPTYAERSKQTP